ncbi:MAG: DNA sulfur modification protein DndE [Halothece sp.]|jgi:DNA sulfur modification protein DndE
MEPPLERIRLSKTGRDQLIKLKRYTKIEQWNILCRWGFCRSLAEPAKPSPVPIPSDSNLELTWRVFGGELSDVLLIALKQRCYQDGVGLDQETLAQQFRLHLHRGISYLAGDPNLKNIQDLVALAGEASQDSGNEQNLRSRDNSGNCQE